MTESEEIVHPQTEADRRRRRLSIVVFAIFSLLVLYGISRVLSPFVTPILLAALVVVLTHKIYVRLTLRLGSRENLAALLMLAGITVVLVVPLLILISLLVQQASSLAEQMQDSNIQGKIDAFDPAAHLGWIRRIAPSFDPASLNLRGMVVNVVRGIPRFVATHGGRFLGSVIGIIVGFVLMLLAGFFFFTDGKKLVRHIVSLSPFPDEFDQEILGKFDDVINATFRGQVLTAIAQGAVTGIGLAIARVPGSIFWGAVAAVFSLLPMVGAAGVWVPASLYLFVTAGSQGGSYGMAIFLTLWGVLVVSTVDNFIRPWAMKGRTDMSAIPILFSILGGISAFGFIGLVLGPLLFALLSTAVRIYHYLFRDALETKKGAT